jgi:two-component sensor histidine kinase
MRSSTHSFRGHLMALGVLVAIPFIAAGGGVSALYVRAQLTSTEDELVAVAKELSRTIDRQLEGTIAALKALSFSPQLRAGDYAGFHQQARATAELFPGSVIALRTSEGQQLVNTLVPRGEPLPRSSDPVLREADARALESNQPVVSNLYVGAASKRPFVIVEFPIAVDGAAFLLSSAVSPDTILRVLTATTALPEGWRTVVLDGAHRVIARTVDHEKFVGTSASAGFAQRLDGQQGTLRSTTLDGVPVVNGYFKSPMSGWTTVISVPSAIFYAPLYNAFWVVGGIGVCGLALSILAAFLYSRYITPPIWRLREEASALAARDTVQPFRTGIRELDAVSEAIAASSSALSRERQANQVLINELNHRVKNTLATVQSIAAQTLRGAKVDAPVQKAFEARLIALSNAHNTLTRESWEGAEIGQIIAQATAPHAAAGRIRLEGLPMRLPPRVALAIAMAMHELATNAAKYGALSSGEGRVSIAWSCTASGDLALTWRETGGPEVTAPRHRGFGTRLIERSLAHDLDGTVDLQFEPAGVVCTIVGRITRDQQTDGAVHDAS